MNDHPRLWFWGVATLCLGLFSACAPDQKPQSKRWQATNAYMNALLPGQTRAAVYLTLFNPYPQDHKILSLEAAVAGQAEIHRHTYDNGLMKMRPVPHAVVPAGGSLVFAPGGYHIMLFDVDGQPKVGTQFSMTMEFDSGEQFTFPVEVRSLK